MERAANRSELEIARRVRAAARGRMDQHIGTGNLSRFGSEKPLAAPTPQPPHKTAAALKREYAYGREKSVAEVEREVIGDSIVLKGKARPIRTAPRAAAKSKEALKLLPTFTVPIARNVRATNKDGATSFHFKHEAIAKTIQERASPTGTNTRKKAGRDHAKYLERDSAVARTGDMVARREFANEGAPAAGASGRAAAGGLYIEREEAQAYRENGVAVIYSNISQDAEERHRFWELVEEHETEPKPDHLTIVTGRAPEFWDAVRNDPRCPTQLALAIEEATPVSPVVSARTTTSSCARLWPTMEGSAFASAAKRDRCREG